MLTKLKYCLLISFILLLFGCDRSAQTYHWDLQSHAVENSIDFREIVALTENINQMSAGRLVITPHPSGAITKGPDIFRAVSEGRI